MNGSFRKALLMRSVKILNILVSVSFFLLCWQGFYAPAFPGDFALNSDLVICVLYAAFTILLKRIYKGFAVGKSRVYELIYSLSLADIIGAAFLYLVVALSWMQFPNALPFFGLAMVQFLWNVLWCLMANKLYFRIHKAKPTAIVYHSADDLEKLQEIKFFSSKFDVQKYIKDPSDIFQLFQEVEGYEVIFVIGVPATLRNGIAKYCVDKDVQGYIAPHVGDIIMAGAEHMPMFSVPIMRIRRASLPPEYLFAKRAFDIFASLAALLIAGPFMLLIALVIRLSDGGPALYRQTRLTKDGKEFTILKFRSMKIDAERASGARLASQGDERITPIGRFIRACRLDELPQLFNILKGDMSIVGPRPERPELAAQYEQELPAFSLRLQVKAGLTGYAQIYGRYNTAPYDKLQMDLMYINHMSIREDLRLMFATVKVLFMKESAEGVETDREMAMDTQNSAERIRNSVNSEGF